MTLSLEDTSAAARTDASAVSIIRREFVALTGDHFSAVILNQLLYWTLRVKDFDRLLEEERQFQPDCNVSLRHGWIYKTAPELNEETMLGLSPPSIRKYLKLLIDKGWIDERSHPTIKWDRTTQYRVNLRNLQEDLVAQGYTLPEVYLKSFGASLAKCAPLNVNALQKAFEKPEKTSSERNLVSRENSEEAFFETTPETEETPSERIFASNERNFGSNERIFASNERNFALNQKFFASNTENTTKTTHKNTNKDHTQRTRARAEFSIAEEMVALWEQHLDQKVLQLTEERKGQLESLFSFHFQNDIRLWERFCLRVKASPFLRGEGARRWRVTLDWILVEANLLKVLEGNFDDPEAIETQRQEEQVNPARDREKEAIIASIKDPVWQKWCRQLAEGARLNESQMLYEPLSLDNLKQIAQAWFSECEDERLLWIGSSDLNVLRKIDGLRLKMNWVFAKEYPKARTLRTRLETSIPQTLPLVPDHPGFNPEFDGPEALFIGENHAQ